MSVFQIALIDCVPSGAASYFNYSAKNIITYTLWEHLVGIARGSSQKFIPGPSWSLRAAHLQAHEVVVYFVLDPSHSVARKLGARRFENINAGGLTAETSSGVVSEVYVEGNMPARRLGNIAFHEIMHAKLDIGARVVNDIHSQGGGGLAVTPTDEWTQLSRDNIRFMSANLFGKVRQYTGAM